MPVGLRTVRRQPQWERVSVHAAWLGTGAGSIALCWGEENQLHADRTEKPLRVVLVSTQRGWHGGEEQGRLLLEGLRRCGLACFVLARHGAPFGRRMSEEGFPVYTFPGSGRGPVAWWQIRRHLRRLHPDVLHYNDPHAITAGGVPAWGLPIPARIASRRVDFPVRNTIRYRLLADCVLCVSQAVARTCRQSGIPERLLHVVYDGVDPRRIASGNRHRGRQALGAGSDRTVLLTVAQLTDCKGHRYLLEAMPAVVQRHPNVLLALAGDGELTCKLQQLADQLGLQEHVRFLGFRNDVPDLVHAADLFVLPSYREGLCSTLIDVMLAQRPIVATTAGGIPEVVGDGTTEPSTAWLVPPRDSEALARAILHVLTHPQEVSARCKLALERAEQRFTAETMIDRTLHHYRQVLAEKQSGNR